MLLGPPRPSRVGDPAAHFALGLPVSKQEWHDLAAIKHCAEKVGVYSDTTAHNGLQRTLKKNEI
ncbi:uncharacterized protein N7469_011090 [Penicillium citrinum]|uniref:Uncharacterized protein n=1 Tax=Penicillium citrinum TaxID=5077 RepID=A0A9W9NCR8_PENCI|nr:uncharacterized protein N7469_011090 [Penicillium citrinum]KAJ5217465.1 hypothetical protein N7469_011090 [Penicillium citrinum]KAK5796856.1 hypothetical protein VI817_006139 [Penicillium citrinum]